MLVRPLIAVVALSLAIPAAATEPPNPQIDYPGYAALTLSLEDVRAAHQLPTAEFFAQARKDGAILLDARSESAFAAGHIEGAINLPLPDFTDEALAAALGRDKGRPIYIYCNNNFSDDRAPVVTKRVELALNIATFINLHGYGYTNVWELGGVLATAEVPWVEAPELAGGG
jgi:hypothetical protein